jgi:integrase
MWGKCGEIKYICNMATINYFVKGKSTLSQIYIRLKDGRGVDYTTKTQLVIDVNNWSSKKGEVKQTSSFQEKQNLQKKLDQLESNLNDQIHKAKLLGTELTKEWLNNCIEEFHGKVKVESSELINAFENHIISLQTRLKKVGFQTTKGFGTTILHIKKYQNFKGKTFHLFDVDNNFLESFITFLKESEGYASSTINKDISRIIQICKTSKLKGLEVNDSIFLAKYTSEKPQRTFVTLTEEELNLIQKYEGADFLENVRDWLIIGCWTGCRIGDLLKLSLDNVINRQDGSIIIRYTQSKTRKTVDVLVHPSVNKIIKRLNGFPRPISDVKFNQYIKELCKRIEINNEIMGEKMNPETLRKEKGTFPKYELVTSHICRRSYATNHYHKLPNKVIMKVTGHATERQFLDYIGEIDSDQYINEFANLYNSTEK